jgi:hypothetical protein
VGNGWLLKPLLVNLLLLNPLQSSPSLVPLRRRQHRTRH